MLRGIVEELLGEERPLVSVCSDQDRNAVKFAGLGNQHVKASAAAQQEACTRGAWNLGQSDGIVRKVDAVDNGTKRQICKGARGIGGECYRERGR